MRHDRKNGSATEAGESDASSGPVRLSSLSRQDPQSHMTTVGPVAVRGSGRSELGFVTDYFPNPLFAGARLLRHHALPGTGNSRNSG